MGRPIKKNWFGPASKTGSQIIVNAVKFADGTVSTDAYIIAQEGFASYIVQDSAKAHAPEIVFMVNAADPGTLLPGQCFILAKPYGEAQRPCYRIAQYRVSIFNTINTTPRIVGAPVPDPTMEYSWSTVPANGAGKADLLRDTTGVTNMGTPEAPVPASAVMGPSFVADTVSLNPQPLPPTPPPETPMSAVAAAPVPAPAPAPAPVAKPAPKPAFVAKPKSSSDSD